MLFLSIWEFATTSFLISIAIFLLGLVNIMKVQEPPLFIIATKAVLEPLSRIQPRIMNRSEVVCIDLEPSDEKLILSKRAIPYECLLGDQQISNQKCTFETRIFQILKNIKSGDITIDIILNYDEIVNLEDVIGLKKYEFTDQYEVVPIKKPYLVKYKLSVSDCGKYFKITVILLEKFADFENSTNANTWKTEPENSENSIALPNNKIKD